VLEFARGTAARHALGNETWPGALAELVNRNRRRYGGYVVHAAVVLLALGVAGSATAGHTAEQKLVPGGSMTVGPYRLVYLGFHEAVVGNHTELRAGVDVYRDGRYVGLQTPGKNFYPAEQQTSTEMAIHTDWLRGEDLDLILDSVPNAKGAVFVKALTKPLVNLIWLAGGVFILGSLIALWPDAREERRLATRYAGARALTAP
jgi:cytochrome c-type biogenesis protein CcmF